MTKKITRLGDLSTGHGNCGPQTATSASNNTLVNSIPVVRVGDTWSQHCDHIGRLASGSNSVFVNGLPVGRVGDPIDCGGAVATGSNNSFAGG